MKLLLKKVFCWFLFYLLILSIGFISLFYVDKSSSKLFQKNPSINGEEESEVDKESKIVLEKTWKELQKSLHKLLILRFLPQEFAQKFELKVSEKPFFYQLLQNANKSFDNLSETLQTFIEANFFLPEQKAKFKIKTEQLLEEKFAETWKRFKKYLLKISQITDAELSSVKIINILTRYGNKISFDWKVVLAKLNSFLETFLPKKSLENIEFKELSEDLLKYFYLFYSFEKQIASPTLEIRREKGEKKELLFSSQEKEELKFYDDTVRGFYKTVFWFLQTFRDAKIFSFHTLDLKDKYQTNNFDVLSSQERTKLTTVFFESKDYATFWDDTKHFVVELEEFWKYFQENYLKIVQKYQYWKNPNISIYPDFDFAIFQNLSWDSFISLQTLSPEVLTQFVQLFLKSKDRWKSDISYTNLVSFWTYFDNFIFKRETFLEKLESLLELWKNWQQNQTLYQIFIFNKYNESTFLNVFKAFDDSFWNLNKKDFFSIPTKIKIFLVEILTNAKFNMAFEEQFKLADQYWWEEFKNKQKIFAKHNKWEEFCQQALTKYKINYYCADFAASWEKSFVDLDEKQKNIFQTVLNSTPNKPFFWLLHLHWAFFSLKYLSHFKNNFYYSKLQYKHSYNYVNKENYLAFFARAKNSIKDDSLIAKWKEYSQEAKNSIPLESLNVAAIKTKNWNCFSDEDVTTKFSDCKPDSIKFLEMVFKNTSTNLDQFYEESFLDFNSFFAEDKVFLLSLLNRLLFTPKWEKQTLNLLHYVKQHAKFSHFKNLSQNIFMNLKNKFKEIEPKQIKKNLLFYKKIDFTSLYNFLNKKNQEKQYENLNLENMLKIYALDDAFFNKFIFEEDNGRYASMSFKEKNYFWKNSLQPMLLEQEQFFQKNWAFFQKNSFYFKELQKIQEIFSEKVIFGQKINFKDIFQLPFETAYEKISDSTSINTLLPFLVFADFSEFQQLTIKENDIKKQIQIIIDEKIQQIWPFIREQFQRFRAAGIEKWFSLYQKNKNPLILSAALRANIDKNAAQLSLLNQKELLDKFLFLKNPKENMKELGDLNINFIFAPAWHDFKDFFNKFFFVFKLKEIEISSENIKISLTTLAPFVDKKIKVYNMDSKILKEIYPLHKLLEKDKLFSEFKAIADKFEVPEVVEDKSLTNLEIIFIVLPSFLAIFLIWIFGSWFWKKKRFNTD